MAFDPETYERFTRPRVQPGLDLIARLPSMEPRRIVDLGCGTGFLTQCLHRRWPQAQVRGIDVSAEMLAEARERWPGIAWERGRLENWEPKEPVGLLYSNATLQWCDRHEVLLPYLYDQVESGGILAIQMPQNFAAPTHALLRETAAEGPWSDRLNLRVAPVGSPQFYYDLLADESEVVDVWETEYQHILTGDDPVLRWTEGTALVPVREALEGGEYVDFLSIYADKLRKAYPKRPDGTTWLPFRRIFVLARKA